MKTKTLRELFNQFARINYEDEDEDRRRWRLKTLEILERYQTNIFAYLGETTRGEEWLKPENLSRLSAIYKTPIPRNIYIKLDC